MTEDRSTMADHIPDDRAPTLAEKMAEAAGMIGPIDKDERNDQQGFNYRSLEAIVARANKAFTSVGVTVIPSVVDGPRYEEVTSRGGTKGWRCLVTMGYEFTDGFDSLHASMISEAIDYGDKSTSKAAQMAYKYALVEVLMIGGDADADAFSPEVIHEQDAGPRPGEWLAIQVQQFAKWGEEDRRLAYKTAMEELGFDGLGHDEAEQVVEHMRAAYYEAFPPSDDEAPF